MFFSFPPKRSAAFDAKVKLLYDYCRRKEYFGAHDVQLFDTTHKVSKWLIIRGVRIMPLVTRSTSNIIRIGAVRFPGSQGEMVLAILEDGTAAYQEDYSRFFSRVEYRITRKKVFDAANRIIDDYLRFLEDPAIRELL